MTWRSKQKNELLRISSLKHIKAEIQVVYDQHGDGKFPEGVLSYQDGSERANILSENCLKPISLTTSGYGPESAIWLTRLNSQPREFEKILALSQTVSHRIEDVRANEITLTGVECLLKNVECAKLQITARSGRIVIENCFIGDLLINFPEAEVELTIEISNSRIVGFWLANPPKIRDFSLINTTFARYKLKHSFLAELDMLGHQAPRINRKSFALLHLWATANGNNETAHQARGEELALQLNSASGLFFAYLWMWGAFANFGLSPLRPVILMVIVAMISGSLMYFFGTEVGIPNSALVGWRTQLLEVDGIRDDLFRALIGSIEGIFSPLLSLSGRVMIVPDAFSVSIFKAVQGYFSVFLVSISAFSLRRRFRQM